LKFEVVFVGIRQMEEQIAEEQGEEAAARAWEAKEEV